MILLLLIANIGMCFVHSAKLPFSNHKSNMMSNALSPNGGSNYYKDPDWVVIKEAPPQIITKPTGTYIELECEAAGWPLPRIQWLKENTPLTETEDYETNDVNDNVGIVNIKSRLIINSVLPIHEGRYSCFAEAGSQTAISVTKLYTTPGSVQPPKNFSDFLKTNMMSMTHSKVRVVLWYNVVMKNMGSDVILPCKTVGTPKADIYWMDNNDQIVMNQDSRIKVLPDGELSITNLQWSDMGSYLCIAKNDFSEDRVSTFIYAMKRT